MKHSLKFSYPLTMILLVLLLGLQGTQPALAVAPDQTITVDTHAPASAVYGASFTVAASSDSLLDVSYSAVGSCSNVGATFTMTSGSGTCTVQYDQAGNGTYDPAAQVTETVNAQPAAITVTAAAKSKNEGDADPALTYSVTNGALVGADNFTGALTRNPGETAGDYAITQGTLALSGDYTLTYVGANLTISAATATATPTPTLTASSTITATPTVTTTPTLTATATDTATSTSTPSPTITATPTAPTFYVSTTGSDSNACDSASAPCLTINGALGKAADGDTINVAAGTYYGNADYAVANIYKDITLIGGWDAGFTTHTGQSIINGQNARGGIYVGYSTVKIDQMVVINSTAALENNGHLEANRVVLLNSRIGLYNWGNAKIYNSTFSGNRGASSLHNGGTAVNNEGGTVLIQYSTVVNNNSQSNNVAVWSAGFGATLQIGNSILANNSPADCNGYGMTSLGHNIFGSSPVCDGEFNFVPDATDQVKVDPKLGPLTAWYYPLLGNSSAINRAEATCPTELTDQRGVTRPQGVACDIGAYEYVLHSISGNAGLVGATLTYSIDGVVKSVVANASGNYAFFVPDNWSGTVTIAKAAFNFSPASKNYASVTTDMTDQNYVATRYAYAISGNVGIAGVKLSYHDGTDKTAISDAKGNYAFAVPLHWSGAVTPSLKNYQFLPVQKSYADVQADVPTQDYVAYSNIPQPLSPQGMTINTKPTYKWSKISNATQYQYQVLTGSTQVFTKTVLANVCSATTCSSVLGNELPFNKSYKLRVRAMVNGTWNDYSNYLVFNIPGARPGYWQSRGIGFYVTSNAAKVQYFTIYVHVTGCGNYRIRSSRLVSITNGQFAFNGSFYASGTFGSLIKVSGKVGLAHFPIAGCGSVSGGPISWTGLWRNPTQPTALTEYIPAEVVPAVSLPTGAEESLSSDYTVERVGP